MAHSRLSAIMYGMRVEQEKFEMKHKVKLKVKGDRNHAYVRRRNNTQIQRGEA